MNKIFDYGFEDSFFTQDINDEIVIYEIEIFEEKPSFPWDVVPLKKYDSNP